MNRKNLTVYSVERYRAPASIQRAKGLKVGGTATVFSITDRESGKTARITAYGASPGQRRTAAIETFLAVHGGQS